MSNKLIQEFNEFINRHRVYNNNEYFTHTIFKPIKERYCFTDGDYQQFVQLYSRIIDKNIAELNFVEKPNSNGVTYLYIDVEYLQKGQKRQYDIETIKSIIKKTNDYLIDNFNVTNKQLTTFIAEKPEANETNDNIYKDGIHIYYPYLPLNKDNRQMILDHLKELQKNGRILKNIKYDKSFESFDIKNDGIIMYGSRKSEQSSYVLTHVFNSKYKELVSDYIDIEELVYLFSNVQYDVDSCVDFINIDEQINDHIDKHDDIDEQIDIIENEIIEKKTVKTKETKINDKNVIPFFKQRDVIMAKAMLKILSKERCKDKTSWSHVAYVSKAIDESLFEDFVDYTKKSSKYNKNDCIDIWNSEEQSADYYTIGTLRYWAQKDNSREYFKIIRNMNTEIFSKFETGKHVDIAQIVYELYKDRFVCADISKKKWFEFQNHRWVLVQSAYTLENLISSDVRKMLNSYVAEQFKKLAKDFDNDDLDDQTKDTSDEQKRLSKISKIIDNLGDVNYRENIVKASSNIFYVKDFESKLDTNVYLVGFLNGVYDLKVKCFRDGLPTDYVYKTVGYDWIDCTGNEPVFKQINKYFDEVFIKKDMRDYILTFIAKILRGIPDTKLHIWNGGGSNAKSTTVDLIKFAFGDYFGVVPVTIITRKRGGSSNATPELADKFGKRCIIIQEPEHNDVVYVGQMKEYTGGDTLMARPLYGDPFYYVPQFTMILTCNNLPYIPANDNGTWRRLRVTPFESEFVEPDDAKNGLTENQFLKDDDLKEALPQWGPYLMWLIITKYYPIYEKGYGGKSFKIREPEIVKQHTNDYKTNSDIYAEFINSNINVTKDSNDTEKIDSLYDTFKSWYIGSYSDKAPDKKTFVNYFTKNKFKVDKRTIYGITLNIDGIDN